MPDPMLNLSLSSSDANEIGYLLRTLPCRGADEVALSARFTSACAAARNEVELFASIRTQYGATSINRQKAERRNAAQIVDALLSAGYELNLNNDADDEGEGENEGLALKDWTRDRAVILGAMFATDDETLCARIPGTKKRLGVFFVYGNADDGSEVVSDYHIPLEPILEPVMRNWDESAGPAYDGPLGQP